MPHSGFAVCWPAIPVADTVAVPIGVVGRSASFLQVVSSELAEVNIRVDLLDRVDKALALASDLVSRCRGYEDRFAKGTIEKCWVGLIGPVIPIPPTPRA